MARGKIVVEPLISHRFNFNMAAAAYDLLVTKEPSLGIMLEYDFQDSSEEKLSKRTVQLIGKSGPDSTGMDTRGSAAARVVPVIGVIGAGNYGLRTFLPALKATGAKLKTIATSTGVSGAYAGRKFGFSQATTDTASIFRDPEINTVFVLTRHNTHSDMVCRALESGQNVYVEKPLAINPEQLEPIRQAYSSSRHFDVPPILMIGFNRRFAPQMQKISQLLRLVKQPLSIIITVNAGEVPPNDWTQDPHVGGGRIIGEGCHFVDLLFFLTGSRPVSVCATKMGEAPGVFVTDDKMSFTIKFEDGSVGTVHYLANGSKSFPKERIEIFCEGRILQLDNFQNLRGYDWPGFKKMNLWRQDKGHKESIRRFLEAVKNREQPPIPFEEILEITKVTFDIVKYASDVTIKQ